MQAMHIRKHMFKIEDWHGAMRRLVKSQRVQTHALDIADASAEWVIRRLVRAESEAASKVFSVSHRACLMLRDDEGNDGGDGGGDENNPEQARKRKPNAWNIYVKS